MEEIAQWCDGELYDFTGDCNSAFEYVCTDSREADEKTMFVATRGERVDGHDYIAKAIEAGCRCVLCEYVPTNVSGKKVAYVVVENSVDAFSDCGRGYRGRFGGYMPTVAITGSVGKTTTKELTAAILNRRFRNYSTKGNFNSVIGMPMSLMEAGSECESAVFEMGMSGFGEISKMTRAATPTVAMVTNIGSSHLEYLGTRENIARAKLEIGEGVIDGGILLLNGDEPLLDDHICDRYDTVYVGYDEKCAYRISNVRVSAEGTLFDMCLPFGARYYDLKLNLVGKHFAYNAAFAIAAAHILGVGEQEIREGLSSYVSNGMRMNISQRNGITVLADCYNAAPESMRAALETLKTIAVSGKRIAVLGDMRELGSASDEMHKRVGGFVARNQVDLLFTLGESGALIADGAMDMGMNCDRVRSVTDPDGVESLARMIAEKMEKGDAVLFKASRGMALERVMNALFGENTQD